MDEKPDARYIFQLRNFLSPEECYEFINFSEHEGYDEAKVTMGTQQVMAKGIRNNDRVILDDVALAERLWQKLKPHIQPQMDGMKAYGLNERFRFYKYTPGQRFKGHVDGPFRRNLNDRSFFTFMIYLNEGCQGGETRFRNLAIKPETGKALIFHHNMYHEGAEVTEGVKYVLRSDVMYRRE